MEEANLLEQALVSWRVNNAITLYLIGKIPKKGLEAVPPGSRGISRCCG